MSQVSLARKDVRERTGAPRNLTTALIVIAFAQLMVVLDTTIVNVALPSIQRALRPAEFARRLLHEREVVAVRGAVTAALLCGR